MHKTLRVKTWRIVSLIFVAAIILIGCTPGLSDYSYKVAGNYQVDRTSAHEISVVPKDGWNDKSQIIPPKVIKIAWNNRYVIAEQQGLKRRSPNNPNDDYEEPDDVFYYWILDTKIKRSYGPFDKEKFLVTKEKFKIPKSMKLKEVSSFLED